MKGVRNRRNAAVDKILSTDGFEDPLRERLRKYTGLVGDHERASAELAAFNRKHAKALREARLEWSPSDTSKALLREFDRLKEVTDDLNGKLHAIAVATLPFLHPRLASTDANVEVTTHEAALDDLDDD